MIIIIESGAIYSAALISAIATYATGNNAQYIVIDFVSFDLPQSHPSIAFEKFFVLTCIGSFVFQGTIIDRKSHGHIFFGIDGSIKLYASGGRLCNDYYPGGTRHQRGRWQ